MLCDAMGRLAFEPSDPRGSAGKGASVIRTYAPATGELLAELPVASDPEIRGAVARARKAQQTWAVLPVEERAQRLLRFRDALADRADELVEILARECGKPRHEALLLEVTPLLDFAGWCCKEAPDILAAQTMNLHLMKHRRSEVRFVPRAVVGIVSPWNFPLIIPLGSVFEALVAGNGCVLKPSEVSPLVALKAKEIFDTTGLAEDLFGVVVGAGPAGQTLIESGIDYCVFTGSVEAGRKVAAACGSRLVPCTLELGGKAPLIACEDCDFERTARAIVFGGFANSGQICISVERVYAHDKVYDRLVERVRELASTLRQGDPARDYVDLGAITFPKQIDVAQRHIEDAVRKGARLVCGGHKLARAGQFFAPTVLSDCTHAMAVMREETFGPVVPIMRVRSDDEAIRLANDSHLGLNAYVFTRSRDRARVFTDRIEAGSVVVNDVLTNYATAEAPFGGIKQSGFGRIHGAESLREMCQRKHVSFDRVRPPERDPLWFPYTARSFHWLQRAARLLFGGGTLGKRIGELF
jgi:succinate-semialdehyde dehydrogenase/glutarate-semialdehyde dehydrogenase